MPTTSTSSGGTTNTSYGTSTTGTGGYGQPAPTTSVVTQGGMVYTVYNSGGNTVWVAQSNVPTQGGGGGGGGSPALQQRAIEVTGTISGVSYDAKGNINLQPMIPKGTVGYSVPYRGGNVTYLDQVGYDNALLLSSTVGVQTGLATGGAYSVLPSIESAKITDQNALATGWSYEQFVKPALVSALPQLKGYLPNAFQGATGTAGHYMATSTPEELSTYKNLVTTGADWRTVGLAQQKYPSSEILTQLYQHKLNEQYGKEPATIQLGINPSEEKKQWAVEQALSLHDIGKPFSFDVPWGQETFYPMLHAPVSQIIPRVFEKGAEPFYKATTSAFGEPAGSLIYGASPLGWAGMVGVGASAVVKFAEPFVQPTYAGHPTATPSALAGASNYPRIAGTLVLGGIGAGTFLYESTVVPALARPKLTLAMLGLGAIAGGGLSKFGHSITERIRGPERFDIISSQKTTTPYAFDVGNDIYVKQTGEAKSVARSESGKYAGITKAGLDMTTLIAKKPLSETATTITHAGTMADLATIREAYLIRPRTLLTDRLLRRQEVSPEIKSAIGLDINKRFTAIKLTNADYRSTATHVGEVGVTENKRPYFELLPSADTEGVTVNLYKGAYFGELEAQRQFVKAGYKAGGVTTKGIGKTEGEFVGYKTTATSLNEDIPSLISTSRSLLKGTVFNKRGEPVARNIAYLESVADLKKVHIVPKEYVRAPLDIETPKEPVTFFDRMRERYLENQRQSHIKESFTAPRDMPKEIKVTDVIRNYQKSLLEKGTTKSGERTGTKTRDWNQMLEESKKQQANANKYLKELYVKRFEEETAGKGTGMITKATTKQSANPLLETYTRGKPSVTPTLLTKAILQKAVSKEESKSAFKSGALTGLVLRGVTPEVTSLKEKLSINLYRQEPTEKQLTKTMQRTKPQERVGQIQEPINIQLQRLGQLQLQRQTEKTITLQRQVTQPITPPVTPVVTPVTPPLPLLLLPIIPPMGQGLSQHISRVSLRKQAKQYKPSLGAIVLNIHGKPRGERTGLQLRPLPFTIPKGYKKKRK